MKKSWNKLTLEALKPSFYCQPDDKIFAHSMQKYCAGADAA
jgi:hypothetical protein